MPVAMYVWVTLEHSFAGIQSASDIFVDIVGSSIIIPQKTLERTDRWKDEENVTNNGFVKLYRATGLRLIALYKSLTMAMTSFLRVINVV